MKLLLVCLWLGWRHLNILESPTTGILSIEGGRFKLFLLFIENVFLLFDNALKYSLSTLLGIRHVSISLEFRVVAFSLFRYTIPE